MAEPNIYDQIKAALEGSETPLSTAEIGRRFNLGPSAAGSRLKAMESGGTAVKVKGGWTAKSRTQSLP